MKYEYMEVDEFSTYPDRTFEFESDKTNLKDIAIDAIKDRIKYYGIHEIMEMGWPIKLELFKDRQSMGEYKIDIVYQAPTFIVCEN